MQKHWIDEKIDWVGDTGYRQDTEDNGEWKDNFDSFEQFQIFRINIVIRDACISDYEHPDFGRKGHHDLSWLIEESLPSDYAHEPYLESVDWQWVREHIE